MDRTLSEPPNKLRKLNNEPSSSLSFDVLTIIVGFCDTREWLSLSYTCKSLNELKFNKELMKNKKRTLRSDITSEEIDKYFSLCRGTLFNVSLNKNKEYINKSVKDDHFVHLEGIHALDLSYCYSVSDKAFSHLTGIHTLDMSNCSQETITDKAFSHLTGIHTLQMVRCTQQTITDKAFSHLTGVNTLHMNYCSQETITGKAITHLAGIHTLNMSDCTQIPITDEIFSHLAGIHTLYPGRRLQRAFNRIHKMMTDDSDPDSFRETGTSAKALTG